MSGWTLRRLERVFLGLLSLVVVLLAGRWVTPRDEFSGVWIGRVGADSAVFVLHERADGTIGGSAIVIAQGTRLARRMFSVEGERSGETAALRCRSDTGALNIFLLTRETRNSVRGTLHQMTDTTAVLLSRTN